MHAFAHRRHGFGRLIRTLLLAGLLLRAVIPAGTMFDFAAIAKGTSPLVLCPAAFAGGLPGHREGAPAAPTAVDHRGVVCVFAAVAMLPAPPTDDIPLMRAVALRLPAPARDTHIRDIHRANKAVRPRAPPSRLSIRI